MLGSIYFIDDENTTTVLALEYRANNRFPNFKIRSTGDIEKVLNFSENNENCIYVLDCNMPINLSKEKHEQFDNLLRSKLPNTYCDVMTTTKLTGVLVAPLIKQNNPVSKIILLTAYSKIIGDYLKKYRELQQLYDENVDRLIPKTGIDTNTLETLIEKFTMFFM